MSTTMAAMSASPATTTLTPPSSSHGNGNTYPWDSPSSSPIENTASGKKPAAANNDLANGFSRSTSASAATFQQNGNTSAFAPSHNINASPPVRKDSGDDPYANVKNTGYLSPPHGAETKPGSAREYASPAESPADTSGSVMSGGGGKNLPAGDAKSNKRNTNELYGSDPDDVSSKWIHRDKLARIESEELQAAGIILPPKTRARSKPRRDAGPDKTNGLRKPAEGEPAAETRSRKNSFAVAEPRTLEAPVPSWDLRLPEEIAESNYFVAGAGGKGSSRIPVAKLSPVPIPAEHLERDTPMPRKRDDSPGAEDSISYPKTRSRSGSMKTLEPTPSLGATPQPKRSATEISPKKAAAGARKTSAPARAAAGAAGRPKTRNSASKDSTSSSGGQTRPATRSGERDLSPGAMSKQPEGDPPWMVSAYKPDPRLPPDQQLLPTVARRLQQERWEREGKFGNIYDREFRPLTDEGFLKPPEQPAEKSAAESEKPLEWPLKTEARSPTPAQGRTGSYSTIPKIQDKPTTSPLPSPRGPMQQPDEASIHRLPDALEDEEQKKGCGCCIIM